MDSNNTATIRRTHSGRTYQIVIVEPSGRNLTHSTEHTTLRSAVETARTLGLARLFVRPRLSSRAFSWHEIEAS